MELVEWAYGLNVFSLHLEALAGRLPDFSLAHHLHGPHLGKGIIFALRPVTMPETAEWLGQDRRDIPFPGERIEAGHPICTVLAKGRTREACWKHLLENVGTVRQEIGDRCGGMP